MQNSDGNLRVLSARYGINQKAVAKWRKRRSVADLPTGPKDARFTVPSVDEDAIIVAFRRHNRLDILFTGTGIQVTHYDRQVDAFDHVFDRSAESIRPDHRLTKIKHP